MILSHDRDADGKLDFEDFLSFYRDSTLKKPMVVRTNLMKYDFRADLRPQPKDSDDDNVLQVRPSIHFMPRFVLGNN